MTTDKTDTPVHLRQRARIAELEKALEFYAAPSNWVYRIDKLTLEIRGEGGGKLVIPNYPQIEFPALTDHGELARMALKLKTKILEPADG